MHCTTGEKQYPCEIMCRVPSALVELTVTPSCLRRGTGGDLNSRRWRKRETMSEVRRSTDRRCQIKCHTHTHAHARARTYTTPDTRTQAYTNNKHVRGRTHAHAHTHYTTHTHTYVHTHTHTHTLTTNARLKQRFDACPSERKRYAHNAMPRYRA